MGPNRLETGAQCCFNKFDCRLFISRFSQFAFYLSLSLSVISKSLAQPCCKWCNLSVSVVLNVEFATNGMYMKNNTHIYVSQTSRNRMGTKWDLCCSLLPHCEALHACCLGFPITIKWWFDQDVKVVPGATFTKRMCNRCGSLQKAGALLQLLSWCCVESVIHHKWDVREEQHTYAVYVTWTSNNRVISSGDLYYCFLPQCEALCTCRSSFLITTQEIYFLAFRMLNTWKWPEMNMYLDLHLATYQYIDGFGCYHFCLNRFALELIIFFWTISQLSVQFWDYRLL